MIRLNFNIKHEPENAPPYALRLVCGNDETSLPSEMQTGEGSFTHKNNQVQVHSRNGFFDFISADDQDFDQEIVLVFPKDQRLLRLIRKNSNSNTILLTEECDQHCIMCSQPPKNKRYEYFSLYRDAILLAPHGEVIGISGGEPMLLKEPLFQMLKDVIKKRPDVGFHILSNGQHFEERDKEVIRELRDNILWGIPLYASDHKTHDDIVEKEGAYECLVESLGLLYDVGAAVELRTVLLEQNFKELPYLADFIGTHLNWVSKWAIMQLENYGYARLHWDSIFVDTSARFTPVETALKISISRGVPTALYNFPTCSVPPDFRSYVQASIADWKQKYFSFCENCDLKKSCCGFFEWHPDDNGFKNLGALQ